MKKIKNEITLKNTKIKVRWYHFDNQIYLHLNFGRYKKEMATKINTFTLYDSIAEDKNNNCEVWVDKVGKRAIGMSIMLSETEEGKMGTVALKHRTGGKR